jgi:hypothetical protein
MNKNIQKKLETLDFYELQLLGVAFKVQHGDKDTAV